MALDGPSIVAATQDFLEPRIRLSLTIVTNELYTIEYGYWLPRPKERSTRANLVFAFDVGTWIFVIISVLLLMLTEAGIYVISRSEDFSWVFKCVGPKLSKQFATFTGQIFEQFFCPIWCTFSRAAHSGLPYPL